MSREVKTKEGGFKRYIKRSREREREIQLSKQLKVRQKHSAMSYFLTLFHITFLVIV